ncbi:MAG: PAS domain S-box protein [Isosphaeraceae bacterium]
MKWMLPLAVSPRPARYAVAIGSAAIGAVLVEFLLPSVGNQFPFLLLYPAVICAAWYGGFGPGLLATVLTALAGDFFLFEPRFTFAIARPGDQLGISLFLVVGGFISWLGEMILRANRRLEKYAREIANQRDISEKRAAELDRLNESLRQSEERYRSLAIATAQIVWTTNPKGEVVEDMPMWRAFAGKSEEELRGRGWVDSLHPEDRERTRAVWSEAVRARSVYETEYRIRKSDGEYRHFAARGVPVLQADGSVREWVGTCTDITERKRAEEALRRAGAYNRRLLEASLDPLVTIGTEGKITDVNEATEAATGYPRAELIGTDFADYFTNPQEAREGYERVFREGFVRDYALEIRHRDGHTVPVLYNAAIYRDEAGGVAGVIAAARDITARKRAEAGLRQQSHLIDLAHDAIFIRDRDGTIRSWNRGAEQMYGWSREEALGHISHDFLATRFPVSLQELEDRLARHGSWEGELIHSRRDGARIVVASRQVLDREERGEPTVVLEINSDVTERKRAEEALRRASAYNRRLLEASLDPLVTIGTDGKITDVNEATEAATGYPRAELIGKDFTDYFTEPEEAREGYRRVFREGLVRDYPLEIRHRDGRVTPVVYNASVYRDEAGQVVGVFAAARDITAQKRAEAELRQMSRLIDLAPDAIFIRGRDGTIRSWNRGAEQMYGWSREEALGHISHDLLATRFPVSLADLEDRLARDGSWEGVLIHSRRDGAQIVVASRHVLDREERGEPTDVLEMNSDITVRKRADDELRRLKGELEERVVMRTAQLEAANKELESFAYSVSHDLRAPLRAIDGFCQILVTEHAPGLDGEPRRYLQRVIENTRKMGLLIDDLLHFSRLGRQPMTRQRVAMADLVRQCLEELQGEREGREVAVILGELPPCRADAALLKQVWLNLLANALKFTRSRAQARIEAGSFARDGETVYFVRDNGVGFDMAYADKLFGVFQRLHRQEDYEGTGVGLALVERIIHRHGGRVWAEAGPDQGAAFFFTLGRSDTDG